MDTELDEVAHRLERYAEGQAGDPAPSLQARIHGAVDAEPDPARGWWGRLVGGPGAWAPVARAFATAGLALAIVGAVAIGVSLRDARPDVGTSPSPSVVVSPSESSSASPSPTPTFTPTPTASPAPTDSPRVTVAPTARPTTASPTASDDDDESETPEPSESDHSGSGGGGGDD